VWFTSKHGVVHNPTLHFQHLNYVLLSLCLAETAQCQILLNCISQCLLSLVSSLFSWLVDEASSQNAKWGRVFIDMGWLCFCNQLGPPVNLWTKGTVGQQSALTVSLNLSRNVVFHRMCVRVWFSASSVMSRSGRFLLVAILLNVLNTIQYATNPTPNSEHDASICPAWPVACYCSDRNWLNCWVED